MTTSSPATSLRCAMCPRHDECVWEEQSWSHIPAVAAAEEMMREIVGRGGPAPGDYAGMDLVLHELHAGVHSGAVPKMAICGLRRTFAPLFTLDSMQGFALLKPHGYAGDWEIIDRIYEGYMSPNPGRACWDHFWQTHAAAKAVRNRKSYFHHVLQALEASRRGGGGSSLESRIRPRTRCARVSGGTPRHSHPLHLRGERRAGHCSCHPADR